MEGLSKQNSMGMEGVLGVADDQLDASTGHIPQYTNTVLAGDVGGTNSRFMLYEAQPGMAVAAGKKAPGRLLFRREYPNEGVTNFSLQLRRFLADANCEGTPPLVACIALAGPVVENRCKMTNRGWDIDGYELGLELGIHEVRLINDFVAAGFGLLTLDLRHEVKVLQAGSRVLGAPIACIGSGTGLGQTFLTAGRGTQVYEAYPTEGGHGALAARTDLDYEMVQWMKTHLGATRISVERVVSGRGLATVYEFLAHKFPERVDAEVHAKFEAAGDLQGAIVSKNADPEGSLCRQAVEAWATYYGMEAGTTCLKFIPLGGLFLAGGMTPKMLKWITGEDSVFFRAFFDQGRVSPFLKDIPVYAVLEEDIGQRGAHYVALTMYQREEARIKAAQHAVASYQRMRRLAVLTTALASAVAGALMMRWRVRH